MIAALADVNDMADVIELWDRCSLTRPWNDPTTDFEFAHNGPASAILTIKNRGRIIGATIVGHDGHRGAIYYFGVDPEFRGLGAARLLNEACENWLRAVGIWKLNLLVRNDNHSALGFYASLGYTDQECVSLGKRLDGKADRMPNDRSANPGEVIND